MELKEFVEKSILDVIDGVKAATTQTKSIARRTHSNTMKGEDKAINFKVSVTTETTGSGGAKISVFSAKAGVEGATSQSNLNEISFKVPVDFSQARAEANSGDDD